MSEVADSKRPLPSSGFRTSGISAGWVSGVVDAPSLPVEVEIRFVSFGKQKGFLNQQSHYRWPPWLGQPE